MVFGLTCRVIWPETSDVTPEFKCGRLLDGVIIERTEGAMLVYRCRGYGIEERGDAVMVFIKPMPFSCSRTACRRS